MYNVGFGDAFLVTYLHGEREHRMLIDCGSIAGGGNSMDDIVANLLERCRDPAGESARIDVVVATHRHKDHISGFTRPEWEDVAVGEVWLPWTEDPDDPQAASIRERQLRLGLALDKSLSASSKNGALQAYGDAILNATGNEQAMQRLLNGFSSVSKRRFLPHTKQFGEIIETAHLPGLRAHVLGPSQSEEVIRDVDPPAGRSYLRMAEHQKADQAAGNLFMQRWMVTTAQYAKSYSHLCAKPATCASIRNIATDSEPLLAATLDKAINGTSLVLVIEIGGKYLLFPGDAQWGTWSHLLSQPAATRLLAKTSLFKVGHHASHNATPVDFVKSHLPDGVPALVSTRAMKNWPDIPRGPLLEALTHKHCHVARSDQHTKASSKIYAERNQLFIEVGV
jgi:beta-lactamase superfamily II metal-dependent hydrolase